MSELAPPPPPSVRRLQRLEALRAREQQIAVLILQQRLEMDALSREDLGSMGARFVADELAMLMRRSPRQSRNRLEHAQMFAAFPAVHALVGAGTWLIEHADAVVDELAGNGLDQEQQEQVLALVLSRRTNLTPWELRAAVRTAAVVLFPEHAKDEAEKAQSDRDVRFYLTDPGGACLSAHGPTPAVAAMLASLDALTFPPAADDTRTVAQRRFDALYDLVCGRAQPGQWQAQVLVADSTLRGEDELPGEIPGLGPIPAAQAREVTTGAAIRRVVVDAVTGRLVAVDDTVHRPDLAPTAPIAAAARVPAQRQPDQDVATEDVATEPDPDAPSTEDVAWHEAHTHRDVLYAHLQGPSDTDRAKPSADAPVPPPVHVAAQWSPEAFAAVLRKLSSEPVRQVDLRTDKYVVPARLRRHLELRDRTCVFPGCPRKALECDKDHLIPWPRGSTSERNLADECEHHHQGKHDCLDVQRLPDGTFRWTTPCGLTTDRVPRPVLDSWTYREAFPPPA